MAGVSALATQDYPAGPMITACISAGTTFLLALIQQWKLDAKAEAFGNTALLYDKLAIKCEIFMVRAAGGRMGKESNEEDFESIQKLFEEVEKRIEEAADTTKFTVPRYIARSPEFRDKNMLLGDLLDEFQQTLDEKKAKREKERRSFKFGLLGRWGKEVEEEGGGGGGGGGGGRGVILEAPNH
ncbi:hypothetical protein CYMTET_41220 [Cymbomonas tetramitiformis]|uniref:SMODS and SLOG-associating 2TM effector domain-containing protein n=1 Tax=Cymbomonas tetramitiformis TaxID=36881 RepID=A0AAE0C6L3_9CHLO|nr:hypothetical protein CYMTET_41220 [Cymbomonas tetramitiformis]